MIKSSPLCKFAHANIHVNNIPARTLKNSMDKTQDLKPQPEWRSRLHEIIFEADTPAGKFFDVALIICIVLSVAAVMLDSIKVINVQYGDYLLAAEWMFTIFFTVEYILRLLSIRQPILYARSFFGIVDLLAIVPTYISVIFPGTQFLLVVRVLRVLRIFRVLKLAQHVSEANVLVAALWESRRKITVFLYAVMTIVIICGATMYLIESEEAGFTSIPRGIYWAIVTLTTVGYGDISPQSVLGQAIASLIMIMGYAIIAVPTGIVTAEISNQAKKKRISTQCCPNCSAEGHDFNALFCKYCGFKL